MLLISLIQLLTQGGAVYQIVSESCQLHLKGKGKKEKNFYGHHSFTLTLESVKTWIATSGSHTGSVYNLQLLPLCTLSLLFFWILGLFSSGQLSVLLTNVFAVLSIWFVINSLLSNFLSIHRICVFFEVFNWCETLYGEFTFLKIQKKAQTKCVVFLYFVTRVTTELSNVISHLVHYFCQPYHVFHDF